MILTNYTKIEELETAKKLKLFTFQHKDVLKQLDSKGYINGEHQFSMARGDEFDQMIFKHSYEWMQKQMQKRLPNYSGELPLWSWLRYANRTNITKRYGPDQIKITAIVPRDRCLVSDFDLYHSVLNKWYLDYDIKKMQDDLDDKFFPTQEEKEKSWEMIFDLEYSSYSDFNEYMGISEKGRWLQVCVDKVFKEDIIKIQHY